MHGAPALEGLQVRRLRVHAVRQADGAWNLASMLPLPQLGPTKS